MTLEQRARLIANMAVRVSAGQKVYELVEQTALRQLREAVDEALKRAGEAPSHREWVGS